MFKLKVVGLRYRSFIIALMSVVLVGGMGEVAKAETDLGVLFVGGNGHHKPYDRMRQIVGPLAKGGVHVTYTSRLDDLNAEHLAGYDAVIIYSNQTKISPEQEKALLDYVAGGGGLVPLHCASYCFLNSEKYIELVGAQFKSHGTGVFRTRVAETDHAIMKDLKTIESWDETYVHHKHNDDRTVLSYRDEGSKAEPWTWVRTHGKGRVFYTAWGHDERTWSNEGFQELVLRGVRWASGRDGDAIRKEIKKPEFKYTKTDGIPFYPPSEKWGTMGKAWERMQSPLSPADSMKRMLTPKEFKVELFASEPLLKGKPIAMAWDAKGRLWVSETVDYPNELQPKGKGRDNIVILEDSDGDGVADKRKVFADKLSIPTSLTFSRGGVIVHQAPVTLFLKDTDGDDVADVREVLIDGWNAGDTHAGPSNLRYGLDNWIWGMQGYAGINSMIGGEHHHFRMGFYRFKADGSKMEFIRKTNNNTWGLGFSEEGLVFGSTANNCPSVFMPIAERYYRKVAGMDASVLPSIAETAQFIPVTNLIRQVDVHGGYTAGAGHALYTARAYPKSYWNSKAFVAGPTGKLLGVFNLHRDGSDYKSSNGFNLLESDDEWTAPIMAEVGPDGQVWVIDWYNYVVQHNPTPKGYKTGKGNAYLSKLRDKKHGRIYRVVYKYSHDHGASNLDLTKASAGELVKTLKHSNMLWRLHAQRLLVERGQLDVVPALVKLVEDSSVDALRLNVGAIHALWTLHGLGAIHSETQAAVVNALRHESAGVRRNVVQVLPATLENAKAIVAAELLEDEDVQVQLAALLALSDVPASDVVARALFAQLEKNAYEDDKHLTDAAAIAGAVHGFAYVKTVLTETPVRDVPEWMKGEGKVKAVERPNLLPNPSFENGKDGVVADWTVRHYSGEAEHGWALGGRSGKRTMYIKSVTGSDTSWHTYVDVKPNTTYELSAWIKTKNVNTRGGAHGAMLNVHEIQPTGKTNVLKATHGEWQKVSCQFNSGGRNRISINLLFGGWGFATGEAWYDDISLVSLGNAVSGSVKSGLKPQQGKTFDAVLSHLSKSGAEPAARMFLQTYAKADPQLVVVAAERLSSAWPSGKKIIFTSDEQAQVRKALDAQPKLIQKAVAGLLVKSGHAGMVEHITGKVVANVDKTPVHEIQLGVIKDQMKYDKKELEVKAGEKVRIVFTNTDHMQHNFLLLNIGSLEKVGMLADKMLTDPQAMKKQYIPETTDILAKSNLVNPHERVLIEFTAPKKPGKYPYVCTFPGHWRIMQGVMTVK